MQTLLPTKRIQYIDALRGFTMILVVFSHVELFGLNILPEDSLLNTVFITFRMPLFFFISGFIAYRAGTIWDGKTWMKSTKKKLLVQLIPTIVFGSLFSYTLSEDFFAWIPSAGKMGYWFTLALLNMFIIYYTFNVLANKFSSRSGGGKCGILLFGLALLLYGSNQILIRIQAPAVQSVSELLCLSNTFIYFQFFVFGNLVARFKPFFERLFDEARFTGAVILIFCFLIWVQGIPWQNHAFFQNYPILRVLAHTSLSSVTSYCGLLIVFAFFRKYQNRFSSTTSLGAFFQYVGKRTLDIYLLHYFFVQPIPWIGDMLKANPNMVLELTTGIALSLLIVGLCLVISNIIRTSDFLGHYLFGAKIPQKQ